MVLECLTLLVARERQIKVGNSCCCQSSVVQSDITNVPMARTATAPHELLLSQLLGSSNEIIDHPESMRTTNISGAATGTLPGRALLNQIMGPSGLSHDNIENLGTTYSPVAATAIVPDESLLHQLLGGLVTLDDRERMRTASIGGSSVSSPSPSGPAMEASAQLSMQGFEDLGLLPSLDPTTFHSMLGTASEELDLDFFEMKYDHRHSS